MINLYAIVTVSMPTAPQFTGVVVGRTFEENPRVDVRLSDGETMQNVPVACVHPVGGNVVQINDEIRGLK